jgi:hypothetical protein
MVKILFVSPISFIKIPTNKKAGIASMLKSDRALAVFWANITKLWWFTTAYRRLAAVMENAMGMPMRSRTTNTAK